MRWTRFLWMVLLLIPVFSFAQNPPRPQRPDLSAAPGSEDDAAKRLEEESEKKANQERYAALKSDTDKLLKLAVELKGYVDKSNEHVLSLEVVKKAEEIEKLAHSVKDKMKGPN